MFKLRRPKKARPKAVQRKRSILRRTADAIDTAIFLLAPMWGAKRRVTRQLHDLAQSRIRHAEEKLGSGWDSETDNRVRNRRWLASELSPDHFAENNLRDLQNRSVELYRRNPIAHSAIEGRVTNEVGVGITPIPRVQASDNPAENQRVNTAIKSVIERWSEHGVDSRRVLSLGGLQRLVARTYATYGECFLVFGDRRYTGPIGLAVEVISPERIETPPNLAAAANCRLGVQYDPAGQVTGYWVRTRHPYDNKDFQYKHEFFPRFDETGQPRTLHIFDPLFPEQSRGIPWLAAAQARIKDLDDFFEAELVAKQIEACFGLIFQGSEDSGVTPIDLAEGQTSETTSTGKRLEDLEPAMIHYAAAGEEVKVVDPSRPGATFVPFVEASLRSIAAALNYPYELLAKNFFRTTYSSGRLALLDGRMAFMMRRQVLIEAFLQPLYRRIVWEAVFLDELGGLVDLLQYVTNPWLYDRHKWQGQGWGFIDPQKDIKAHVNALDGHIETHADVYGEQGQDWEAEFEQEHEERKRLVANEVELRKLRWDLEEAAGLPHADASPQVADPQASDPQSSDSDDETPPVDPEEDDPEEAEEPAGAES